LVVRGAGANPGDLAVWNAESGWRASYDGLADGVFFFFAEDVFGGQFGLAGEDVVTFDPETGEREVIGSSLEDWAEQLLADFDVVTGHSLAQAWQRSFGPLPLGERLIPKTPFVLGGGFEFDTGKWFRQSGFRSWVWS
jgi:hypothetical protein